MALTKATPVKNHIGKQHSRLAADAVSQRSIASQRSVASQTGVISPVKRIARVIVARVIVDRVQDFDGGHDRTEGKVAPGHGALNVWLYQD